MAPLALLYDVHGNLPALEAVLAEARDAGAKRFLLGGDYGLFGPFPAEVVATLQALDDAAWIRGNVDRWGAEPGQIPAEEELLVRAVADYREALGDEAANELGELPEQVVLDGTRYCHASPLSDLRSFLPEPGREDDELLGDTAEPRLVFGHTHLQFRRTGPRGVQLLNPGSVGMPLDGDVRAAFALVHDDASVELRRVKYDNELAVGALRDRFGAVAWAQRTIKRLVTAEP